MEELKDALLEIAKAINRLADIERDKGITDAAHWSAGMLYKKGDYGRMLSVLGNLQDKVGGSEIDYDD